MVGNVKYIVRLTASERETLEGLVNKGKVAAAKRKRTIAHLPKKIRTALGKKGAAAAKKK